MRPARWGAGVAVVVIGAAAAAPLPDLYLEGPPPGFSGGFGEASCYACHFSGEENEAPGELAIRGLPERYAAGETYPVIVTLKRREMVAAGFQLTARFEGSGRQAGTLRAGGEGVAVATDREVEYAHQLAKGAELASSDSASWTVLWTAPVQAGAVRLNVAANAADGDGTAEGDRVYTATATTECRPASSSGCDTGPSAP